MEILRFAQVERGADGEWGDAVEGTVVKKLTEPTEIKGHHVAESEENPELLVRSGKTGAEAAHMAGALEKKGLG